MVRGHRRRGLPEHRHHRVLRARIHGHPGRRPCLQDGLRPDAAAARRFRRRRDHRLPRGAADGGHGLRRDARRCRGSGDLVPGEAQGPAGHPGQPRLGPGQHGHLRVQHQAAVRPAAPRCRRRQLGPRFRQQHHPASGQAREGGGAPVRAVLRQVRRRGRGLLARCRHGRRLLGGQYRPHQPDPGAGSLRPELADLDLWRDHPAGQVRPRRGGPARPGRELAGLRRLHRLRRGLARLAAVHRRQGPLLRRRSTVR